MAAGKERIIHTHDHHTMGARLWQRPTLGMVCLWVLVPSVVKAESPRPLPLDSLPKPPAEIAKSIRDWQVRFETGERARSDPATRRLSAETRYEIAFTYHCQPQWSRDATGETIQIRMTFSRITWQPKHTIWLRRAPASDKFWDDPLVRHELDHVRLSADQRMKKRFEDLLRSQRVITPPIEANQIVDRALVDRLISQHVANVFQQVTDLIDIRYRELDRVTRHGRLAIPEESMIRTWLK